MRSPNKVPQDALEKAYVEIVATQPCACCAGMEKREVHEFEQGQWFTAVNLCFECHRGVEGWHGTRARWKRFKCSNLLAIQRTVRAVFAIAMQAKPAKARAPTMRAATPRADSATQRSSKTVPRRVI